MSASLFFAPVPLAAILGGLPVDLGDLGDLGDFGNLGWIDTVGLVLAGALMLLGFIRGLWWQVIRLVGIVAAVGCARAFATPLGGKVGELFDDMPDRLAHGIAWAAIFVAGLVIVALFGLLGKKSLEAMQLGLVDRAGGALAGLVTAIVVHSALIVGLVHVAPEDWTRDAMRASHSRSLVATLGQKIHLLVDEETSNRIAPWLIPPDGSVHAADDEPK